MRSEELLASQEKWHTRFGAFVREGRRKKGLTQVEVCKRLNISQSFISDIENGRRNVDFGAGLAICNLLEIDLNDLLRQYKTSE